MTMEIVHTTKTALVQCYVRGPPPLPSLHTMGSGCGDLPGPMAALADFDDHDLEEVCLPDSKHIHTADA